MLRRLEAAWSTRWAGTPPVGHLLPRWHRDRWVRFHTLPESKRCPDSEREYRTILDRHHTLLDELGLAGPCLVTSAIFTDETLPAARPDPTHPRAVRWRVVAGRDVDEDMDTEVFASELDHPAEELDLVIRAVVDEQLIGVIVVPPEAAWLYHPYDGGADVIAGSPQERDRLREKFSAWLPPQRRR